MSQYAQPPARFFPSGVASQPARNYQYSNYPKPNPVGACYYENDFHTYAAGDWTVAPATGTSATSNAAGFPGGFLRLTTGAVSGNAQGNSLGVNGPSYQFGYGASNQGNAFGGQVWFSCAFIEAASLVTSWTIGMTAGTADVPTSGVYFTRATTSAQIQLTLNKGGTTSVIALPGTQVISTYTALGFYYDGKPTPTLYAFCSNQLATPTQFGQPYYQGGVVVASAGSDPFYVAPNVLTNLPLVLVSPSIAVHTNAASAVSMDFDYLVAAQEHPLRF